MEATSAISSRIWARWSLARPRGGLYDIHLQIVAPEPATFACLLGGLSALGLYRKRRA
jgi:hypothetical protein